MIDTIWDRGGAVASLLWDKGTLLTGDVGFYLAAAAIYALIGFVCVYTMFLIALSRIALAVLLAIGPVFIVLALFDATRRFFEAWLHELANYAIVTVLTVAVTALVLDLVEAYAAQTAARGATILTVDALNLALAAGLVLLVLKQVLPMAARLAGGVALSGYGVVERALAATAGTTHGLARYVVDRSEPILPPPKPKPHTNVRMEFGA
jgi:type IV secretion system protein VirB6